MAQIKFEYQFVISLWIYFYIVASYAGPSSLNDAANTLLKFKDSLKDNSGALSSWSSSTSPCFGNKNNWVGIICSRGGSIWGIRLENMKLEGSIDVESLAQLPRLRSLSFIRNNFGGQLFDFRKLKSLKSIYLSHNNFEGSISPNAFEGMRRLRKVHLEYNRFSGEIPTSLGTLSRLNELGLEGNQFQGPIPTSLSKFRASTFAGNIELCGPPLQPCKRNPTNTNTSTPLPSISTPDDPIPILAIVFGVIIAIILATMVIIMIVYRRRRDNNLNVEPTTSASARRTSDIEHVNEGSQKSTTSYSSKNKSESGKLTFIKKDIERFDLPDLLKASAEILGSGCFGSSYKATFNNGNVVVVKRFKKMNNVGRDEFQEHMRRLGRVNHINLLPIMAYYYRKEEKLFITQPMPKGSLALLLHGQTRGKPTLDWPTRLKVIKGVARGLSYLYKELPILVAPHGHLKSSNVLLNNSFEPILSDYGLIPLINQESVQEMMVAYKSPEYFDNGRITKKTDVWSLGILILETLTGKFPSSYLQQGGEIDMSSWVASIVNEGVDKNMAQTRNGEGEVQKLLDIGMACCAINVDERLDIKEACERIEEVRERDNDDDFYSTCASTEADVRSSRGLSDDFTLIIN